MAKFITLNEAKMACKLVDEEKYDGWLDTLIKGYTASIQQWLHRDIISDTYTEYHDIKYKQVAIFLKQYPVTSIAGATSHGTAVVEGTDYNSYYDKGMLRKKPTDNIDVINYIKDYWYEGDKEFEITYTAGYASTAIPDAIKLATMKLVRRDFYDSGVDDIRTRKAGEDYYTRYDLTDGMPPGIYTLLHPFRRQFK